MNILCATDLLPKSDSALERAAMLAERREAQLVLIHVLPEVEPHHLPEEERQPRDGSTERGRVTAIKVPRFSSPPRDRDRISARVTTLTCSNASEFEPNNVVQAEAEHHPRDENHCDAWRHDANEPPGEGRGGDTAENDRQYIAPELPEIDRRKEGG